MATKSFKYKGITFSPIKEESLKWLGRRYRATWKGNTIHFNTKKEAQKWANKLLN